MKRSNTENNLKNWRENFEESFYGAAIISDRSAYDVFYSYLYWLCFGWYENRY